MSGASEQCGEPVLYSIYLIGGPSGRYVGCTDNLARRWSRHKFSARSGAVLPLYLAMRRDGVDAYSVAVVAQARGKQNARRTEWRVILNMWREQFMSDLVVEVSRERATSFREDLSA